MLAIVNIGQLVTLAGPARPRMGAELRELGIIEDAALLIEDGRIAAAGAYSELKSKIPPHAVIIDADGRCVTPGFVDAHTHLVFAGNRAAEFEQRIAGATYQQIAAAGGGILRTVALTRAASEEELLAAARRHRDWMLRSGTTTIEAKSGYGLDRETELRMLRVMRRLNAEGPARIVPTLLAAHTVPPEFADRRAEYVRWIAEELIPEVAARKLARLLRRLLRRPRLHRGRSAPCSRRGPTARPRPARPRRAVSFRHRRRSGRGTRRGNRRPSGNRNRRDAASCCARPACSRCCCRARSSRWAARSIRLRARWSSWAWPSCSPRTSTPARRRWRRCRSSCRWRACRCALTPAEALTAATINAAWSLGLGKLWLARSRQASRFPHP